MDNFEKYILKNKYNEDCRALICVSYKKYSERHYHKIIEKTNTELATYGDALLKFALCNILLDNKEQLSVEKAKYESDKVLIEIIAKHYNLLEYIKFDKDDEKIKKEYKYYENDNTKYIATTVEAVLGALYQENKDFKAICELVESWIDLINKANNSSI